MTLTIDRLEQIDMDEAKKEQLIAEVRCGRAWLTFLLYDLYGPVPLADLKTLKNPLAEIIVPRATEEEMQTFIEEDLLAAAEVLPYNYKKGDAGYGRFTRGLCYTLLLKFYMLPGVERWGDAEAAGWELTDPQYGYDLVPEYKDIFTVANEKNVETIFAVGCQRGEISQAWSSYVLPNDYPSVPANVVKYQMMSLAWPFVHTYDPADKRLTETIITEYLSTAAGRPRNEKDGKDNDGPLKWGAIPMKYEIDPNTSGTDMETDFIIYRYADVLTLLAEAIVRNNNTVTTDAIQLLNRTRTRALPGKPFTAAQFPTPAAFLDSLLLERAHELYCEGHRRSDLIRHGKYIEAMQAKAATWNETTLVTNEDYYRFPIPQSIINEGKGIIEQNPGY
jgi:hypothetical protein